MSTLLRLDSIDPEPARQARVQTDDEAVERYALALLQGESLPDVVVYHEKGADKFWLGDGEHRRLAYLKEGRSEIPAEVREGTRRDAFLHAAGANYAHGLPLKRADKRKIVTTLLLDEEWRGWSDKAISRQCRNSVSDHFVGNLRRELAASANVRREPEKRKAIRKGKVIEQNPRRKPTAPPPSAPPPAAQASPPPVPTAAPDVVLAPPATQTLSPGTFRLIVVAAPWEKGVTVEELRRLRVDELAAPDFALLLLRSDGRRLREAMNLLEHYRFNYHTTVTARVRGEYCAIFQEECEYWLWGVRGNPLNHPNDRQPTLVESSVEVLDMAHRIGPARHRGLATVYWSGRRKGWVQLTPGEGPFGLVEQVPPQQSLARTARRTARALPFRRPVARRASRSRHAG
jgi:hypothetical protein